MFEIKSTELAARIGKLYTKNGNMETPALLPVLHPVNQLIDTSVIKRMGFEAIMTNSYITWQRYGDEAVDKNIHKIVDFEGPIMTDSGGYQVLEYGKVDVGEIEIARFQENIDSDFCNRLDKTTSLADNWETARNSVTQTLEACEITLKDIEHKSIWMAPIQGGKFLDLVEFSAKQLSKMNFDMFALGSPTEIMENYDYTLLAKMIITAKKNIPSEKALHLFGLGHPLPLSMAVALGCDTFDSASYILYAKHGRYFTENGTRNIDELEYLPCICETCNKYSVREMRKLEHKERISAIGTHNLWLLWKEIVSTRQAIREGRLWEYVGIRARSHPKMWDAFVYISNNMDEISEFQKRFKSKGMFLASFPDNRRPELRNYQKKLADVFRRFENRKIIIIPVTKNKPLLYNNKLKNIIENSKSDYIIGYIIPPIGFVPYQITDIYPISHMESSYEIKKDKIVIDELITTLEEQFSILNPKEVIYMKDNKLNQRVVDFIVREVKPKRIIEGELDFIYTELEEILNN